MVLVQNLFSFLAHWHFFCCNFPRLVFLYILYTSVITCIFFTAYHNEFILSFASSSCLRLVSLITHMLCKDDLEVMIWVELKTPIPSIPHLQKLTCPISSTCTLEFPHFVLNCMFFL